MLKIKKYRYIFKILKKKKKILVAGKIQELLHDAIKQNNILWRLVQALKMVQIMGHIDNDKAAIRRNENCSCIFINIGTGNRTFGATCNRVALKKHMILPKMLRKRASASIVLEAAYKEGDDIAKQIWIMTKM